MGKNIGHENVNLFALRRFIKHVNIGSRLRSTLNSVQRMLTGKWATVVSRGPFNGQINEIAVKRPVHARRGVGWPLDEDLFAVFLGPIVRLSLPVTRVHIEAPEFVFTDNLSDRRSNLTTRDRPIPFLRVPHRRPTIWPI